MERLEDLQLDNLFIYQDEDLYKFTSDSVLLSDFARIKRKDFVVDFGTGSGIIPLLIYGRYKPAYIVGIEIQQKMCEMAQKSIEYNNLTDRISIILGRIQDASTLINKHPDVIVCNPPYRKLNDGISSKTEYDKISKFEYAITLSEIIESGKKILKDNGRLYMINSVVRFPEIAYECKKRGMSIRRARFIQSKANTSAHLVLVEIRNNANSTLEVLPPLILKNEDNSDTEEVIKIYNNGENYV